MDHPLTTETDATPRGDLRHILHLVPLIGAAVLFVLSLVFIHALLSEVTFADINTSFWSASWQSLALCILFTAASYLLLMTYDIIALRSISERVPVPVAAYVGYVASAMSQTLGFGALTGSAVRFRIYGSLGLPAAEIGRIAIIAGLSFWLGLAAVASASMIAEPDFLAGVVRVGPIAVRSAGLCLAILLLAYLVFRWLRPEPVDILGWSLSLPGVPASCLQILVGAADMLVSAAALWVLLPGEAHMSLAAFAGLFSLIVIAGFISHIPGSLGVLEAGMLLALPQVPPHSLLASLLLYRCLYYVLPFFVAAGLLALREARPHFVKVTAAAQLARPVLHTLTPPVIAVAVFAGGLVLLLSGATPALETRMEILRDIIPLPFIEVSHLIGSVVGFFLLLLSIGLYRRLDAAWSLGVVMLSCGIVVSLAKGLDWEEAFVLAVVLGLALMSRSAFYRQSSLLNEEPSPAALIAVALACAASIWIGYLAYKQVDYSSELWWQVAYSGDAPRFLRASLLVVMIAGGFGAYLFLRPARGRRSRSYEVASDIVRIVALAGNTEANLALTGDKQFLVAPERDAFLMYDVQGTSWIVMGDPVGNAERFDDLLWRFRELVDRRGGKPVFYEVSAINLPRYLDLGLSLLKLGEEALIDLPAFSLDGGARANLRQSSHKAERQGLSFSVVASADMAPLMAELREISDAWLNDKNAVEKQFSVGHFDPAYLARYDVAVIRQAERIVAFANLWQSAGEHELSVDLMRHRSDAPRGHMDFLFVQLLLWGKERGFKWFSLGMAPLSGLEGHPLAPAWHKAGNLIFQHGEQIYGFEGLRAFKEKFRPEWRPRYLACPGGLSLPLVLLDVAVLISRRRKLPSIPLNPQGDVK
jgi:phosphatidylglycerol lysyltransferase